MIKKMYMKHGLKFFLFILIFTIFFNFNSLAIVKIVILLIIFFMNLGTNRIIYKKDILFWGFCYILLNLFYMVLGTLLGALPFKYYSNIYLLEPIIYFLIFFPSIEMIDYEFIKKCIVFSLFCIDVILLVTIIMYWLGMDISSLEKLPCGIKVNRYMGYISFYADNIMSIFFIGPFFIMTSFKKNKILYYGITFFTLVVVVISGRRALMAVLCLAIMLNFLKKMKNEKRLGKFLMRIQVAIIILGTGVILFLLFYSSVGNNFRIGNLSDNFVQRSMMVRNEQADALISDWKKNPILGVGYGQNAQGSVRSSIPGMYEYTYLALLFQTGIVGFVAYMILYGFILVKLYKVNKNTETELDFFPLLVAYLSFMLGNATNPYLYSFDGMFCLFLPLAIINKYDGRKKTDYVAYIE